MANEHDEEWDDNEEGFFTDMKTEKSTVSARKRSRLEAELDGLIPSSKDSKNQPPPEISRESKLEASEKIKQRLMANQAAAAKASKKQKKLLAPHEGVEKAALKPKGKTDGRIGWSKKKY